MANFATHFATAAGVSLMGASTYLTIDAVTSNEALLLFAAGILGGILPDVDSDHSRPLQIVFTGLYFVFVFSLLTSLPKLSIVETWLMLGGVYLLFREALLPFFRDWTIHRGIFHSLLAAVFFAFLTSALLFWLYGISAKLAWLAAMFVFIGYLVHLLLDELYSVDFNNKRLKRSWGTAFKLLNTNNWVNSTLFLLGAIFAFQMTPPTQTFIDFMLDQSHYEILLKSFLPNYLGL